MEKDTIETNEPTGEADITPSVDTSVDNTQPVEAETGTVEETLLAGKYKSPEELEKAYNEIQKTNGQLSQKAELANLLEEQTGMNAQQIKDYITRQEQAQLEEQIANNPAGYALQEVQSLKSQLALKEEENELNSFIAKSPEFEPYKDKIFNLGLNLHRDKSYEEIANEYFGQARAQGQQDAYRKIENKTQTQNTASVSGQAKSISVEDLKGLSSSELESMLPHA